MSELALLPGDAVVVTTDHFEIVLGDDGFSIYFRHNGMPLSCGIHSKSEARRLVRELEADWQADTCE